MNWSAGFQHGAWVFQKKTVNHGRHGRHGIEKNASHHTEAPNTRPAFRQ